MKQIIINNKNTPYFITENEKLITKKSNKFLKGSNDCGYLKYTLRFEGKKYDFRAHRLVAQYFLENPLNLPIVHHINNDKLDNRVSNLKWVTIEENNKAENKIISNQIKVKSDINYIEGEEWYQFRDTHYYCSNYGRVMNNKTKKILRGSKKENGYKEFQLTFDNKKRYYLGHRLVYESINKVELTPKDIINHKDGNKINNNINNLELISQKDNVIHMLYKLPNKICKKILQFNLDGDLIREYSSCAEAARANSITPQSIQRACSKGYKSLGYIWKYKE